MPKQNDAKRALSQAKKNANEYRKKANKLLKAAQLDLREYRKELSALKRAGIVSKKIDARKHRPTRYMLSKLAHFKDVALGHAVAVPSKKLTADREAKYIETGTARKQGNFLIVPKTAKGQRAAIIKNHLAVYTPLGMGEERVIFLPYDAKDLNELIRDLENHESEINQLKERTEQFGFQLFGHNAKRGFVDAEDLHKYLTQNYSHLLSSPKAAAMAFKEFVLIRFKNKTGMPTLEPYHGVKLYGKRNERRDDTFYKEVLKKRASARKAAYRAKETPEQHRARLDKQKIYDQSKANDKMEMRVFRKFFKD